MKGNILKLPLMILSIFLLGACNHAETIQHIEVFEVEVLEKNEEGFYETTGYKKVNGVTTTEESENHINTDIKAIEDYYDTDGNYIRTEIIHSTFNRSHVTTQAGDGEERKEELQEPSTILIPDENTRPFELENMTKEEKEKVKEHVLSFMDRL